MFGEKLAVPHSGTLTRATLRAEFIELEAGKRLFWSKSMKKARGGAERGWPPLKFLISKMLPGPGDNGDMAMEAGSLVVL